MKVSRRWLRRMLLAVGIALGLLVLAAFPFGPLFPWSPWKPGYRQVATPRADVYYPAGSRLPAGFDGVDRDIAEAENLYGVRAPKRVTVILCRSWSDFWRFLPFYYPARGVGAAALQTGTAIYLTPRLAERGFDHGEFLRHELSHAVLHQNQHLWDAARTSRAESFFEGLAVSFGRQRAFVPLPEALAFVREHDIWPLFAAAGAATSGQPRNMRLNYQVWRLFVEYLQEAHGRDRFLRLLDATMADPGGYRAHVANVYRASLETVLRRFRADVRAGRWKPRDGNGGRPAPHAGPLEQG